MKKLKQGLYLIINQNDTKLVIIISEYENYWITSDLKKETIILFHKRRKLNAKEALAFLNKEIKNLSENIKELKLHAADQRGEETKNILKLQKKINKIKEFKTKFIQ